MEEGEDCEFVCKEFRFGTTSDMFIGKLSEYVKFLKELETLISQSNNSINEDK